MQALAPGGSIVWVTTTPHAEEGIGQCFVIYNSLFLFSFFVFFVFLQFLFNSNRAPGALPRRFAPFFVQLPAACRDYFRPGEQTPVSMTQRAESYFLISFIAETRLQPQTAHRWYCCRRTCAVL